MDWMQLAVSLIVNIVAAAVIGAWVVGSMRANANQIHTQVSRLSQAINKFGSDLNRVKAKVDEHHKDIGSLSGQVDLIIKARQWTEPK